MGLRDSSISPKQLLKSFSGGLLREILDRIPPHDSAHRIQEAAVNLQFCRAAYQTRRSAEARSKGLFSGHLSRAKFIRNFSDAGYPEPVAELLTGLFTNSVPQDVIKACPARPPR